MKENNNQLPALLLSFCVIGAVYGIIFLFGMLIGLNSWWSKAGEIYKKTNRQPLRLSHNVKIKTFVNVTICEGFFMCITISVTSFRVHHYINAFLPGANLPQPPPQATNKAKRDPPPPKYFRIYTIFDPL